MDFILEQLLVWWQFTLVGILILIGLAINIVDRVFHKHIWAGNDRGFTKEEMPYMQPLRIPTKDKGFWGGIWLWLMCSRNWTLTKDFYYTLDGEKFVIPAGFTFDGASIPKFLWTWLSPIGILLVGGLIHDYGYKYQTLLKADKKTTIGIKDQKWMDTMFRDVCIEVNGFHFLNYLAYWALRLGGFVAWNSHRKVNAQIEGVE